MDRLIAANEQFAETPSFTSKALRFTTLTALAFMAFGAATASALTLEYVLTPNSRLVTAISSSEDFFADTGQFPTWLDGSLATPPVSYGSDVPERTKNVMRVDFTDDGNGNIINGPITITYMDYYHPTDASIPGLATITGLNDSTISGATGTLVGTTVTSWSTNLTGTIHNELTCVNAGGAICGTFGLPATGTTNVVHDVSASVAIDTAAAPVAASLPMTFSPDFSSVTMEMTLATSPSRQHYAIAGAVAPTPVPSSSTGVQLFMLVLMTLSGLWILKKNRAADAPTSH